MPGQEAGQSAIALAQSMELKLLRRVIEEWRVEEHLSMLSFRRVGMVDAGQTWEDHKGGCCSIGKRTPKKRNWRIFCGKGQGTKYHYELLVKC